VSFFVKKLEAFLLLFSLTQVERITEMEQGTKFAVKSEVAMVIERAGRQKAEGGYCEEPVWV
jgi:hypothetical protein